MSHKFASVCPSVVAAWMRGDPLKTRFTRRGESVHAFFDWIFRPVEARSLCYPEFVSKWVRCPFGASAGNNPTNPRKFIAGHPGIARFKTRLRDGRGTDIVDGLRWNFRDAIPLIRHPRLPRKSALFEGTTEEELELQLTDREFRKALSQRERYGEAAVILTIAFGLEFEDELQLDFAKNSSSPWWDCWNRNKSKATVYGTHFLLVQEEYHADHEDGPLAPNQRTFASHATSTDGLASGEDSNDDDEVLGRGEYCHDQEMARLDELIFLAQRLAPDMTSLVHAGAVDMPNNMYGTHSDISSARVDDAIRHLDAYEQFELFNRDAPLDEEKQFAAPLPQSPKTPNQPLETLITVIDNALNCNDLEDKEEYIRSDRKEVEPVLRPHIGIAEAITRLGLSIEQGVAFRAIASAWLYSLVNSHPDFDAESGTAVLDYRLDIERHLPPSKQLIMSLLGSGGTGKSKIIHGNRSFCTAWGYPPPAVTATSGIAATSIGGMTWHRAMCRSGYRRKEQGKKKTFTSEQYAAWAVITMMIIDECSMMGAAELAEIDCKLRILKGNMAVPFGGVHMVFVGDFFQLPPVVGTRLFRRVGIPTKVDALRGLQLWRNSLNTAVNLKFNYRAAGDAEFARILENFRQGRPTAEDIRTLNTRVLSRSNRLPSDPTNELTVIVPWHKQRKDINRLLFERRMSLYPTRSRATPWVNGMPLIVDGFIKNRNKNSNVVLDEKMLRRIQNCTTFQGHLGRKMVPRIRILFGARYIVTANLSVLKGLSNGMIVHVKKVVLKQDAIPTWNPLDRAHVIVATDVRCIYVEYILNQKWQMKEHPFPRLPVGHGILTLGKNDAKKSFVLRMGRLSLKLQMTQFNLMDGHAITGHKAQGLTIHTVLMSHFVAKKGLIKKPDPGWMYVALSRATTINQLYLTERMPAARTFAPRHDVICEMARLKVLAVQTRARFETTADGAELLASDLTEAEGELAAARRAAQRFREATYRADASLLAAKRARRGPRSNRSRGGQPARPLRRDRRLDGLHISDRRSPLGNPTSRDRLHISDRRTPKGTTFLTASTHAI